MDRIASSERAEATYVSEPIFDFVGRHLLANFVGCDRRALNDLTELRAAMNRAVEASGATLLRTAEHVFPQGGYTLVMLLSESHASIHTYPEFDSCFIDLFTCGDSCSAEKFEAVMRDYLRPVKATRQVCIRHQGFAPDAFGQA